MKFKTTLVLLASVASTCGVLLPGLSAQSEISLIEGDATVLLPPSVNVSRNQTQDNTEIFIVDEGVLDISTAGLPDIFLGDTTSPTSYSLSDLGSTLKVHSYLFHWDAVDVTEWNDGLTVFFDNQILGYWGHKDDLYDTDPIFQPAGTTYETSGGKGAGFESDRDSNNFFIGDLYGENVSYLEILDLNVGDPAKNIDQFRVLTLTAIPEPSTIAMMFVAGCSVFLVGKKRIARSSGRAS